jgi:hypothetical protein
MLSRPSMPTSMTLLQVGILRLRDAIRLANDIPAFRMTIQNIAGELGDDGAVPMLST